MAQFRNGQVEVDACGLAVWDRQAYYISAAGPKVALKSLWASLVTAKGHRAYCSVWEWQNFRAAGPLRQFWAPLPESNWHHAVFAAEVPNLLRLCVPEAARPELDNQAAGGRERRAKLLAEHRPALLHDFIAYLNATILPPERDVPLVDAWGEALWDFAMRESGWRDPAIRALDAYGDCLSAWLIKPDWNWLGAVTELLRQGRLPWPEPMV